MTPLEVARAIDTPINRLGSKFMFDGSVYADAAAYGFAGLAFYTAGRCGVLGDVDADVAAAAMGFFEPSSIRGDWEQGIAAHPAHRCAELFADACAAWGEAHLGEAMDDATVNELVALARRAVEAAPIAAMPLFAGWRRLTLDRAADGRDAPRGAALVALNALRELRGGAHLVAVAGAGIAPLDAVMATGGVPNAQLFGWPEPHPDPDEVRGRVAEPLAAATARADGIVARAFEPFDDAERARFAELVAGVRPALV